MVNYFDFSILEKDRWMICFDRFTGKHISSAGLDGSGWKDISHWWAQFKMVLTNCKSLLKSHAVKYTLPTMENREVSS